MKKRRITKIAVSLILTLSMLLSLPLYLCAADSHDYYYDNPEAVYPAEPYTYTDYPSPDGAHTLRVRHNVVNGVTYYDALVLMRNEDNGILRTFDLHRIHNFKYGFDGYGVHWSPRGNYIIVDHPNPEHGRAVLVIDVQNREYWMPPSTVDNYNSIRAKDKTIPPRDDSTYFGVWKFEEWELDTRATLVAEYRSADGSEMYWSRMTLNTSARNIPKREWGDALDFDDPRNTVWTKPITTVAPAYNNADFTVTAPDGGKTVIVHAAMNVSDAQTWGALYDRVTVMNGNDKVAELNLCDSIGYPIQTQDVIVHFSKDSRYAVIECGDADLRTYAIDFEADGYRYLFHANNVGTVPDDFDTADAVHHLEAFSVFGDAMHVTEFIMENGEPYYLRMIDKIDCERIQSWYQYDCTDGIPAPIYDVPSAASTTKDGFTGFIAVSKTHETGLDGLFRIGEQYKYIHMEAGKIPYNEYVSDAHYTEKNALFDRYTVVYSAAGCWVLDENEKTVYAGTGGVTKCGNFALTYNVENGVESRRRLFDEDFHLVMDYILGTAVQPDGSVYVSHTVGRGAFAEICLSHIAADGTVTRVGAYDGDLSEFRQS